MTPTKKTTVKRSSSKSIDLQNTPRPIDTQPVLNILDPEVIEAYFRDDKRYVAHTTPSEKPLVIIHAQGTSVWSADGRKYLDFIGGMAVNNVGHSNPEVRKAIIAQAEQYSHVNTFGKFVIPVQVNLARRLAQVTPPGLTQIFFTNSGTESIEGALKLARKFTGRKNFIAFEGSFHGRTFGSLSVSWRDIYRKPFEPLVPGVSFIPFNDLIAAEAAINDETAAVIVEPIQGEGGIRVSSDDFLPGLRKICDKHGAFLILDEVQTGFGRTGRFFACQRWNVTPDILVVAKALGGGMPLGGFIAKAEVMTNLTNPALSHMTTFGGHPISCAAGLASLEIILRDHLVERSEEVGEQIRLRLRNFASSHSSIVDVRGKGLMIGLEFVTEEFTRAFVNKALELGVILSWTVYSGGTVRIAPPLNITQQDLDAGMTIIETAIAQVEATL